MIHANASTFRPMTDKQRPVNHIMHMRPVATSRLANNITSPYTKAICQQCMHVCDCAAPRNRQLREQNLHLIFTNSTNLKPTLPASIRMTELFAGIAIHSHRRGQPCHCVVYSSLGRRDSICMRRLGMLAFQRDRFHSAPSSIVSSSTLRCQVGYRA
jgi:hypothetical protein